MASMTPSIPPRQAAQTKTTRFFDSMNNNSWTPLIAGLWPPYPGARRPIKREQSAGTAFVAVSRRPQACHVPRRFAAPEKKTFINWLLSPGVAAESSRLRRSSSRRVSQAWPPDRRGLRGGVLLLSLTFRRGRSGRLCICRASHRLPLWSLVRLRQHLTRRHIGIARHRAWP